MPRQKENKQMILRGPSLATMAVLLSWGSAVAQDGSRTAIGTSVDEIVITAERRESNLQRTPLAVTALSQSALDRAGITDFETLSTQVPGVNFGLGLSTPRISIRGIGTENILGGSVGGDPGVAVYTDGVVIARPQGILSPFFDLERIEVLRGPQGTLYGRNATGGAINLITKKPTPDFEGFADFRYGNLDQVRVRAAVGGPILDDRLMFRVAGYAESQDGEVENIGPGPDLGARDIFAIRAHLLANLTPNISLLISGDIAQEEGSPSPTIFRQNVRDTAEGRTLLGKAPGDPFESSPGPLAGGTIATAERTTNSELDSDIEREVWGVSARLEWELQGVTITSITGYREIESRVPIDIDGTEVLISTRDTGEDLSEQFSQEIQFASNNGGDFEWLLGGYYFYEDGSNDQDFPFTLFGPNAFFSSGGTVQTNSFAVFGQASYFLTDQFKFTAGLRWTRDEKEGDEFLFAFFPPTITVPLEEKDSALTPRVVLEYLPTDDILAYVSISRGFKSGGLNLGALQGDAYGPEFVWAYEGGLKARFLEDRLQVNAAGFYYDYNEQQLNQLLGLVAILENVASSRIYGAEVEIEAIPFDNFLLDLNISWTESEFREFFNQEEGFPELGVQDVSGNVLPRTPKWKLDVGAQYTFDLQNYGFLTLRGDATYTGKVYFTEFNRGFAMEDDYVNLNARATWEHSDSGLSVSLYGTNLTDVEVVTNATVQVALLGHIFIGQINPARKYGFEVSYRF